MIADEEPLTTDFTYRPESLGHYVPALERVHLDGKALAAASPETLDSVLAHELAHHFVLVAFPESRRQLWLSEGLACALETTVVEDGAAFYPLLQPVLLQVAREQAISDPRQARLRRWTAGGDIPFLAPEERERSYAMAWSLVYFLLERQLPGDLPLSRRVAIICELDPESLDAMEDRWLEFLRRFDVTEQLIRLATGEGSEERHLSVWAVKQLGALRCVDEGRALRPLSALSIGPDEPDAAHHAGEEAKRAA